jgi:uncharacterized protein YdaU (DUF1376 family)
MHYYQFNIGDYASHTRYLTPMQDLIYRRLLDLYYLHEKPIPEDSPCSYIGLNDCSTDVQRVLNEYFILTSKGWINKRADQQIDEYKSKQKSASLAGKKSAEVRKAIKDAVIERPLNERTTDVQPTIKHKPITIKQETIKRVTPEGVLQNVWDDFLQLRKEKRSAVTDTVIRGIEKEARKAGLSLNDALEHCCVAGWQSFNAEWYAKAKAKSATEAPWVQQNREWFDEATGRKPEKDFVDMETNVTRIAK